MPKKSGDARICVDLKALNNNVMCEVYPIPTVEETLAQVTGATVFSKLDANSGYWQIPLSESSKHLTTFVTPSGRYCFNRLPFGASEIFHKCMSRILAGCKGVLVHHDDVLVHGKTQQEHDANLLAALKRLEKANVTLNPDKCKFSRTSIDFLGQIVDKNGIRPDPAKTQAVLEMEPPQSMSDLRRFMGMVNQLGKFSPRLHGGTEPTPQRATEHQECVDLGSCSRPGLLQRERGDDKAYSAGHVRCQGKDQDICRCFILWTRCRSPAA